MELHHLAVAVLSMIGSVVLCALIGKAIRRWKWDKQMYSIGSSASHLRHGQSAESPGTPAEMQSH